MYTELQTLTFLCPATTLLIRMSAMYDFFFDFFFVITCDFVD